MVFVTARPMCGKELWVKHGGIAAFHSSREGVFTRSRDPGNHEFTT